MATPGPWPFSLAHHCLYARHYKLVRLICETKLCRVPRLTLRPIRISKSQPLAGQASALTFELMGLVLSYIWVESPGFEPEISPCKRDVLPLLPQPQRGQQQGTCARLRKSVLATSLPPNLCWHLLLYRKEYLRAPERIHKFSALLSSCQSRNESYVRNIS